MHGRPRKPPGELQDPEKVKAKEKKVPNMQLALVCLQDPEYLKFILEHPHCRSGKR